MTDLVRQGERSCETERGREGMVAGDKSPERGAVEAEVAEATGTDGTEGTVCLTRK